MKLIVKSSKKPTYACFCVKIHIDDPTNPCDPIYV